LEGMLANREKAALITLHQNAQRLLKPLEVLNPYAQFLTFPDQTTRLRRDHEKYLTLIDTIAFIHQHQRAIKTAQRGAQRIEYIEVTLADIELANRIAHDVLGRSLDELPPQTRRLLKMVDGYVVGECQRQAIKRADLRFSRRALREGIAWGDTQLKIHLARLVELEYLITHRTKTGGFDYELVYDTVAADGTLRLPGLVDVESLACAYDAARSAPGRGVVGPQSVGGRDGQSAQNPVSIEVVSDEAAPGAQNHFCAPMHKRASYTHGAQGGAPTSLATGG